MSQISQNVQFPPKQNAPHQLSVAEEMHPVRVNGLAVLCPAECGDRVAPDWRGDPQSLPLVHCDVPEWAGEGGFGLVHALLHAGLDGDVASGAGLE